MNIIAPQREDFTSTQFSIYEQAQKLPDWSAGIDWSNTRHEKLPNKLKAVAWRLSSQSAYAEQLGMINASNLLSLAPNYSLRISLAQAVSDEARHACVFARYAIEANGSIGRVEPDMSSITASFGKTQGFHEQFLLHILLEALALDEFAIFSKVFEASLLSSLYTNARIDESRHVAMGVAYLREECNSSSTVRRKIEAFASYAVTQSAVPISACEDLERLSGNNASYLFEKFQTRQAATVNAILSQ